MGIWYYYDAAGAKQGPINDQQLKFLVIQKRVVPETQLETDGGHLGKAGQVPGLFAATARKAPEPTPQNTYAAPQAPNPVPSVPQAGVSSYCTNCGAPVSEQAVACMTCGAQPMGHRKFCRVCGVAFNPEQVVCVKCGSEIAVSFNNRTRNPDMRNSGSNAPFVWMYVSPLLFGFITFSLIVCAIIYEKIRYQHLLDIGEYNRMDKSFIDAIYQPYSTAVTTVLFILAALSFIAAAVIPIILWSTYKNSNPIANEHGKNIINGFLSTIIIGGGIILILFIAFFVISNIL